MDMIRSFLPVGQGAFYTEQFADGTNVIYDCGSENGIRMIEEMIKSTFHKGDVIHAVFISHMHGDHMNGLEFLLKYCNVGTIYLPYLTPKEKQIATLVQEVSRNASHFITSFIIDPMDALEKHCKDYNKEMPRVKYVLPQDAQSYSHDQIERNIRHYIFPGTRISITKTKTATNWVYIPFNLKNEERTKLFVDQLGKMEISIDDSEHIRKMMRTQSGRTKIRKAYEAIPGGLNTNSLVVYSGPDPEHDNDSAYQSFGLAYKWWSYGYSMPSGCLYLGDFDAHTKVNYNLLEDNYTACWDNVGVIQIPHHGSKHNFNSRLLSKAHWFVISAGSENRYKHPHASVLKEIIAHRKPCVWATEKIDSIGQFLVQRI